MASSQRTAAEMRDYIRDFSLDGGANGSQGYGRVILQLCGPVGSGKSMLINSCKYVLDEGDYVMHASDEPTSVRRSYALTPNITIADNRPWMHLNYSNRAIIYAQLGGFTPLDERVERISDYDEMIEMVEETDMEPNYTDLIVPVIVYRASSYIRGDVADMTSFLQGCRTMTGITPIVVITCKNDRNAEEVERQFRLVGAEQVLLVENYTQEDNARTLRRDSDVLTFLYTALQDVVFRMSQPRDATGERTERKKFLIKYMHLEVVAEEIEKMKRQWRSPR